MTPQAGGSQHLPSARLSLPSQETGACVPPPGWQVQPFANLSTPV